MGRTEGSIPVKSVARGVMILVNPLACLSAADPQEEYTTTACDNLIRYMQAAGKISRES